MSQESEKLIALQEELALYNKAMGQAADTIVNEKVSKYPILIIYQEEEFKLGINIINQQKVSGNWSVNASTLEQFVEKGIIDKSRIQKFKATYKSPVDFICIFSLTELGAQFLFLPRKD